MGYYIDLTSIKLDDYKLKLEKSSLLPSRMILKEKLDERFNYFKSIGISNVHELRETLKKKQNFNVLSKTEVLSEEYLTILLRELNSIHPKPIKIKEFEKISQDTILKLENAGVQNTVQLYDYILNTHKRKTLEDKSGLDAATIYELTKLTDLSRIRWVGAKFARMLYYAGYDTVEKVAKANHEDLYQTVFQINKEHNFYNGQIGLNDMKLCIEVAKDIPLEIEY